MTLQGTYNSLLPSYCLYRLTRDYDFYANYLIFFTYKVVYELNDRKNCLKKIHTLS